jgi:hypothetical protein
MQEQYNSTLKFNFNAQRTATCVLTSPPLRVLVAAAVLCIEAPIKREGANAEALQASNKATTTVM